jgi:hypothetical protein
MQAVGMPGNHGVDLAVLDVVQHGLVARSRLALGVGGVVVVAVHLNNRPAARGAELTCVRLLALYS